MGSAGNSLTSNTKPRAFIGNRVLEFSHLFFVFVMLQSLDLKWWHAVRRCTRRSSCILWPTSDRYATNLEQMLAACFLPPNKRLSCWIHYFDSAKRFGGESGDDGAFVSSFKAAIIALGKHVQVFIPEDFSVGSMPFSSQLNTGISRKWTCVESQRLTFAILTTAFIDTNGL